MMLCDVLIRNGTVVTMDPESTVWKTGSVAVSDDKIVQVGEMPPGLQARETVDASGCIVMPGLINTHTHCPMSLFRGLADDLPLDEWLTGHIFPAESDFINPESVHWGTLLSCAEMLLSGTTTCCDGYFHEHQVAQAFEQVGMRAVLGQGVIDFPAPGVADAAQNIDIAVKFVDEWRHANPLIEPSIFCHSPYTCSPQTLTAAKQAARRRNVLFQIHLAETALERDRCLKEFGASPVRFLERLGILDARTLAIHCVWIDAEDIEILYANGVAVSHNPESNMKLASGVAPIPAMVSRGLTVALGTDGCASNNDLDLFGEMDTAAKLHKAVTLDPTIMEGLRVLKMATRDAARVLGLEAITGSLEPGKAADLILVDFAQPHLTPVYNPVSHLVYSTRGHDVRDVMVAGRWLVRKRRPVTLDLDEILDRADALGDVIGRAETDRRTDT